MNLLNQFKEYLLSQDKKASKITIKNYLSDINHFIRWYESTHGKTFEPKDVTTQTISLYKQPTGNLEVRNAKLDIESLNSRTQDVKDSSSKISNLPLQKLSNRSMERHLSSLRKFFTFLKLEGKISYSPFEQFSDKSAQESAKIDPFRLKGFKSYLYVFNASHLTIKNYLIDIKQFLNWTEEVLNLSLDNGSSRLEQEVGSSKLENLASTFQNQNPTSSFQRLPSKDVLNYISGNLLEEYKQRLVSLGTFSPATINRKLSSLRKYTSWLEAEGLIENLELNRPFEVRNAKLDIESLKSRNQEVNPSTDGSNSKISNIQPQEFGKPEYSGFPPLRLLQKVTKGINLAIDATLITQLVKIIEKAEILLWKTKGMPVFVRRFTPIKNLRISADFNPRKSVSNIKKELYAPLEISTKFFPWYKKAWFSLRYKRPNWYKTYHSYAIVHYFHFAVLVIFAAGLVFGFYTAFIGQEKTPTLAANVPTSPNRILNFQGRLTDNSDNPITSATNLRFSIYTQMQPGTGSAILLWQEVNQVAPDTDGIFNTLLGNTATVCANPLTPATGQCSIPSTLFSENNALFLGVTVEATPELTPRQQLATVAFASNSETLQGLVPITATGSGTTNVVLALDSTGNLTIGGSATPIFQATGGLLTLSGQPLLLTTKATSNGNIQLAPDGTGKIDLTKPLVNTSISNNIASAVGSVEIDDLLSVLATSSGQSALTINQTGAGPLISASASGANRFAVDNSGNIRLAGGQTSDIDTFTSATLSIGTLNQNGLTIGRTSTANTTIQGANFVNGGVLYGLSGAVSITSAGALNNCLIGQGSGSAPIFSTCPGSGVNWWNQLAGALSPVDINNDFAVGGTSTASAKFSYTGIQSGNTIASISGQLLVYPNNGYGGNASLSAGLVLGANANPVIQTTKNQLLTLGGDTTGNITLSPNNGTGGVISFNAPTIDSNATTLTLFATPTTINMGAATGTLNLGNGGAFTIATVSSDNLTIAPNGTGALNLATTNTGAVTIGNSTGTFSLTSNGGLNVTTGGALTGVASIDTITTSATALTFAGAGSLAAGGTSNLALDAGTSGAVNIAGVSTGDVNIAGGSSATGCTILNASGNLACSGGIYSTATTGIQGWWNVASGSLYPTNSTLDFLFGSQASVSARFKLTANNFGAGTLAVASISGKTSFASLVVNNDGVGDLFTASASGWTRFKIGTTGAITSSAYTTGGGIIYATSNGLFSQTTAGSTNECLKSQAGATPIWGACGTGGGDSFWGQANGLLYPGNSTVDLAIGGTASSSAKFLFANVNSGTPTLKIFDSTKTFSLNLSHDGTNGNIISTTGTVNIGQGGGTLFLQTDIQNDSNNYLGAVRVSDRFNVFATDSANAAFIVNNTSTGDILTASAGGAQKFTITNAGGIRLGTSEGSANNCLLSGGTGIAASWSTCGGVNWWNQLAGLLSPVDINNDFAIGGTATSTAKFSFTGVKTGQTIASLSGQLIVMPNNGWGGQIAVNKTSTLAGIDIKNASRATQGTEKITNSDDNGFTTDTGNWTTSGSPPWKINIAGSSLAVKDAPGTGALTLSNSALDSAPAAGTVYRIEFDYTTTASSSGSITVTFGGGNFGTFGAQPNQSEFAYALVGTATSTTALTFTPSSGWYGTLDWVYIYPLTTASIALRIESSNGTINPIEFRAGQSGNSNIFVGENAGYVNVSGSSNNAFGNLALAENLDGTNNNAFGSSALEWNTTGWGNTAIGDFAMRSNITGILNTAVGQQALWSNTYGDYNVAIGDDALKNNNHGNKNSAVGDQALLNNTTGNNNIAFGYQAGDTNITGNQNTFLGYLADSNVGHLYNASAIGAFARVDQSSSLVLGAINGINSATESAMIGIGTTIPLTTLDVRYSSGTLAVASISGKTSFATLVVDNSGVGDIFTASASGAPRFRITNQGNVLPGADNLYALGASPSARWKDLFLGPSSLHIQCKTTDAGCPTSQGIDYSLGINSAGTFGIGANLNSNSTPTFNITQGGNVGIGTTTPTELLEIASNSDADISLITNANAEYSALHMKRRRTGPAIVQNGDALGTLNFTGYDGATDVIGASIFASVDGTPGTNDMPGRLEFYTTTDGASSATERMRITNTGNVGIGTTSPTGLQINTAVSETAQGVDNVRLGTLGGSPRIIFEDSGSIQHEIDNTAGIMRFYRPSNISMSINESGRVGIGNFTSGYTGILHVNANSGTNNALVVLNQSGTGDIIAASASGATKFRVTNAGSAYATSFYDIDNSTYYLDPAATGEATPSLVVAGNVGIGTATPAAELQVAGTTSNLPNIILGNGNTATGGLTSLIMNISQLAGGYSSIQSIQSAGSAFGVLALNPSGGNVGIGTISPDVALDVQGSIYQQGPGGIQGYLTDGGILSYKINKVSSNAFMDLNNSAGTTNVHLDTSGNSYFLGGNVGIGMTPTYTLDVAGTIRATGEVISTNANQFRMVQGNFGSFFRNDGADTYLLLTASLDQYGSWNTLRPFRINNTSGDAYLQAAGTGLYARASDGYIGIGDISPTNKLDVTGGIGINDLTKIDSNGQWFYSDLSGAKDKFGKVNASGFGISSNNTANYDLLVYAGGDLYFNRAYFGYGGTAAITTYDTNENLSIDPNGTGITDIGGDARVSSILYNGRIATYNNAAGNLHIDAGSVSDNSIYLNYYDGDNVKFGNGALGVSLTIASTGNMTFAAANPSITASSYITMSGGLFVSGGTLYTTNEVQARGGIADDGGNLVLNDAVDIAGKTTVTGVGNAIQINGTSTGATNVGYLSFYESNGTVRKGYIGDDSGADSDITFYSDAGSTVISSANFVRLNLTTTAGTYAVCHGATNGTGIFNMTDCNGSATDIAEFYPGTADLEPGDLVSLETNTDTQFKYKVIKTTSPYDPNIIGVVSTIPTGPNGEILGDSTIPAEQNPQAIGLAGRVAVKVSLENGPIHANDYLTSSSIPGVAMKASKASRVIGRAIEDYDGSVQVSSGTRDQEYYRIVTEITANKNPQDPPVGIGKILMFTNPTWYDPDVYLTSTGDFAIKMATPSADFNIPSYYSISDILGNPIDRVGAFKELISADIRAGSARIEQLSTNSLAVVTDNITIAGQSLRDYIATIVSDTISTLASQGVPLQGYGDIISPIASIDTLNTDLISPLANNHIEIAGDINIEGNATISGQISANQLSIRGNLDAGDASISGTLRAGRILATDIVGLNIQSSTVSANYITNNYYASSSATSNPFPTLIATSNQQLATSSGTSSFIDVAPFASELAYVENLSAATASFSQGLMVFGSTTLSDTSIVGQLSVNGSLILADNSINVLGSDLNLQPLRQGGLSIMAGLIYIDTNGNVTFGADVTVKGTLYANIISPIPGNDLTLRLGNQESGITNHDSQFIIHNSTGSGVLAINSLGDLIASGAGTFSKLNLGLVSPALALSPTEVIATGSAGVVVLKANKTQVTILNNLVTEKSLIYITPVGQTLGQNLYLLRQIPDESFTVGINAPVPTDIKFNFLIIN